MKTKLVKDEMEKEETILAFVKRSTVDILILDQVHVRVKNVTGCEKADLLRGHNKLQNAYKCLGVTHTLFIAAFRGQTGRSL